MAETIIRPAAPEAFEQFGSAVASHRDTLVVGARHDLGYPGRVYVFVWSGAAWVQQTKLQASNLRGFDDFGAAVALDGDCLVVGAPYAGPNGDGHAYVFRRTGTSWVEEAMLAPSVVGPDGFGQSVAVHGDDVVVGGPQAAYFFRRSGGAWAETARVVPPGGAGGRFGNAVAIWDDHAVVGDEWEGGVAAHHGAAYVYRRSGSAWDLVLPVLTAPDAVTNDHFGQSVAIRDDRLIVGAPGVTGAGVAEAGAAYVYVRAGTSWGLEQKLEGRDVDLPHGVFSVGASVSLWGEFALIGNPTDHHPHPGSGSAFLYQRSGSRWARVAVFRASNPHFFDYFSHAVSVSDAGVFIGAPDVPITDYKDGLVYAHPLPANPIDRLRLDRDWSRYADILFGLIRGGPGVIVKPGSGPVPVDPEPFVDWRDLAPDVRARVLGEALTRIGEKIDDRKLRERVVEVAKAVAKKAEQPR
jgi:hypothetical protein